MEKNNTTGESKKRSANNNQESTVSKKLKTVNWPVVANKSPVAVLNEIKQGLEYKLLGQVGPVHAPVFSYSVSIDNETFIGKGRNKKQAKAAAAARALNSFIQFPDRSPPNQTIKVNEQMDFSNDDIIIHASTESNSSSPEKTNQANNNSSQINTTKGPVMILNELFPGLKYQFENLECGVSKFKVSVEVQGETFFGTGENKKNAKAAAARSALSKLYNMTATSFLNPLLHVKLNSNNLSVSALPQQLADYIGNIILTKFNELMSDDQVHCKRKVIAGIVQTDGYSKTNSKLISLATGTKCISGEHISVAGTVVNDTHAEIVARRCLVDYLYMQLDNIRLSSGDSIFELRPSGSGYRLKPNIKFHLYINTAPCGDARIFSPHEINSEECVDKHPNRKARGLLRTIIESGEGTIPVTNSYGIQMWDGVLQGERLLTMSCSDKICKWNVLGVQGALLSNLIEPIYLDSIILGSLMHPLHMNRAIFGRIESAIQGLAPPFKLNKPHVSLLTSSETRRATKAPNFSVNWTTGMKEAEVLNSITGKTETGASSRICKRNLFRRYLNLVNTLGSIKEIKMHTRNNVVYKCAKESAVDYKIAKAHLFAAFQKQNLGNWMHKPVEQDLFEMSAEIIFSKNA